MENVETNTGITKSGLPWMDRGSGSTRSDRQKATPEAEAELKLGHQAGQKTKTNQEQPEAWLSLASSC